MSVINDRIDMVTVLSDELPPTDGEVAIYVRTAVDDYQVLRNQADVLIRAAETVGDRSYSLYCECGCSGIKGDRPTFSKLMADIELGKFKRLYISDISRLTRNIAEVYGIIQKVKKFNVEIVVLKI